MGFDWGEITSNLPYLFKVGMVFTLTLTGLAMAGGIVFGTILAMMRLSSFRVFNVIAGGYVNLMRSIPLVLVIFWFFFLVPYIGGWVLREDHPIQVGAFYSAVITFTMFEAAYYCEIMRAGIQSIPRGQVWSGYALGLNYWQTMGHIVLPQAFRNMLPVLLTQTIILFQDTSLVYVISVTDFFGAAAKVANRDYRLVEMYTFCAVVYFVISFSLSMCVTSSRTTRMCGSRSIVSVTRRPKSSRSTARACPAGTEVSRAMSISRDPARRISSLRSQGAVFSLSDLSEFEQTSSAKSEVWCAGVERTGRIS